MAQIQWYPGHMTKAKREMEEKIKLVDMVMELRDARVPQASENPILKQITNNKPRLVILTKTDKAEPKQTQEWVRYFTEQGVLCAALDLMKPLPLSELVGQSQTLLQEKRARDARRGIRPRPMRAMIIGIPNVGKSTLINRFAKRKATITGDRPGVTKATQWIKVSSDFELLDTPGVLWPKFEEYDTAVRLAITGAIKDQILPKEEVATYALQYIFTHYPHLLTMRYGVELCDDMEELFVRIAQKRLIVKAKGEVDISKTMDMFLKEIRDSLIGRITWEIAP